MHLNLPTDKRYYSIGELATAFDVNTSLIRFWDKEFDILKPKKNAKGNRMFTPEDVKNL
jgi:DNA-binding transcriptional MerR regulator